MSKHRITRKRIVEEMVTAAAGCFNHYSDEQLSDEMRRKLSCMLADYLPDPIKTEDWKKYAASIEAERAEEERIRRTKAKQPAGRFHVKARSR